MSDFYQLERISLFIIGLLFGSFSNVIVYRLPLGLSPIVPRSFCPKCNNKIKWKHNIPVLSWIFLKGKCAFCNSKISPSYLLLEISCAFLFLINVLSKPTVFSDLQESIYPLVAGCILFFLLFVISIIDLKHFWIPQSLINTGFLLGMVNIFYVSIIINSDFFYFGLIGSIVAFLLFEFIRIIGRKIYKKEVMGKGDSKLIAMLGLWLGPLGVILTIAISYISAAIIIMIGIILKKINLKQTIPFGPFISLGGIIVWIFGNDFFLIRLLS